MYPNYLGKQDPDEVAACFEIFIKYATITTEIPAVLKAEEGIEMAIRAYRKTLADPDVQYMMHLREKAERIEAGRLADARMEEKQEIARRLVEKGMSRDEIQNITRLSDEEMKGI